MVQSKPGNGPQAVSPALVSLSTGDAAFSCASCCAKQTTSDTSQRLVGRIANEKNPLILQNKTHLQPEIGVDEQRKALELSTD